MIKKIMFSLSILFFFPVAVAGFDISVLPETIRQGDAFLIKIQSNDNTIPVGMLDNTDIVFHRTSPGHFIALSFAGLEQHPETYIVQVQQNNSSKNITLRIKPRKSRTINLSLPRNKVTLTPENEERAENEIALLRAKWSNRSERMWKGRFTAPLDTPVSTEFGILRIINGHRKSIHKGIDYRGKEGTPIKAINAGIVSLTDDQFFGGKIVMVDHGEGIFSIYMHLSAISVYEGQHVNTSDTIGYVGSSGRSTGPHLHLTVKWNGLTIDPLSLFSLPLD